MHSVDLGHRPIPRTFAQFALFTSPDPKVTLKKRVSTTPRLRGFRCFSGPAVPECSVVANQSVRDLICALQRLRRMGEGEVQRLKHGNTKPQRDLNPDFRCMRWSLFKKCLHTLCMHTSTSNLSLPHNRREPEPHTILLMATPGDVKLQQEVKYAVRKEVRPLHDTFPPLSTRPGQECDHLAI